MSDVTVLYDACVLYPAPLRDLLMQLALSELYRAKWSERIHQEWMRNVLKNRPDLSPYALEQTKNLMNGAILDCLVEDYEDVANSLHLPDPNDNHVLAAAIVSGSNIILTFNIKDFPASTLNKYAIETLHPDDFLLRLVKVYPDAFFQVLKTIRMRLKKPPKNALEYLEILAKQGLKKTVLFLQAYVDLF